jgi:hypothetical protein
MGKREVSNLRLFFSKKYIYDVARWTLGGLGEAEKFTSAKIATLAGDALSLGSWLCHLLLVHANKESIFIP